MPGLRGNNLGSITKPVFFVVGPTGVGKTRLAVTLAERFRGEIINADSRQVYRHMDIGTAKPSPQERSRAPHHLLDLRDPDQTFDLGSFLSLARLAIKEVGNRGRLPIVVGGSGQYIWALLEGWQVPQVAPDPVFRKAKEAEAARNGPLDLHRQLQQVDPQRAAELDPRNIRRVIRALEVYNSTRRPASQFQRRAGPIAPTLVLGLTLDRQELYRRIDSRVEAMMAAALEDEVRQLAAMGFQPGQGPLASPGYAEIGRYLTGESSLAEAVQGTKFQTHRLARRQYTWFKAQDPRITWLDAGQPELVSRAASLVEDFLSGGNPCDTMSGHYAEGPADEVHQNARGGK